MYGFLDKNKLIYSLQFGFKACYSTNVTLISTIESIKSCIDTGDYIDSIFIDIQKAFDTVNHDTVNHDTVNHDIVNHDT